MWGRKQTGGEIEGQTDDRAAWQFRRRALSGAGPSGNMPGIVYYEFAELWIDRQGRRGEDQ